MKQKVTLFIMESCHEAVVLENLKGDTFTYNPLIHEDMEAFITADPEDYIAPLQAENEALRNTLKAERERADGLLKSAIKNREEANNLRAELSRIKGELEASERVSADFAKKMLELTGKYEPEELSKIGAVKKVQQLDSNNTDTAREFLRNYMKWEDSQGNKLMEVRFVENALVSYASRFTPAPIKSGHDFLKRKLKEGWRLEASDMTNCLAALLDEYGQRTPAPIESGQELYLKVHSKKDSSTT